MGGVAERAAVGAEGERLHRGEFVSFGQRKSRSERKN